MSKGDEIHAFQLYPHMLWGLFHLCSFSALKMDGKHNMWEPWYFDVMMATIGLAKVHASFMAFNSYIIRSRCLINLATILVATLTSSSQLSVECKSTWNQKTVSGNKIHSHKWGRIQNIESNDSQVHSHFERYTHVKVLNIHSLSWKGKKTPIWAPKLPLKRF